MLRVVIRNVILVFLRSQNALVKRRGLLKSKRKKEIELERERERERERYRIFQKRDARALRFGSMNSITI